MKKALSIAILFVMLIALIGTGVKAATESTLAADVYAKLAPYGATSADKVKLERYLKDVSEEDGKVILGLVNDAVYTMDAAGTKNVKELKEEDQQYILNLAKSAAATAGLKLTTNNGKIELLDKDGKLLESAKVSDKGTLAYTSNNGVVLFVSALAVFALATVVVAKVKSAKVEA